MQSFCFFFKSTHQLGSIYTLLSLLRKLRLREVEAIVPTPLSLSSTPRVWAQTRHVLLLTSLWASVSAGMTKEGSRCSLRPAEALSLQGPLWPSSHDFLRTKGPQLLQGPLTRPASVAGIERHAPPCEAAEGAPHCFPRLWLTSMVLNLLHIQAFKEAADSWAHLRVTRKERETQTERDGETEGRKEVRR